MGRLVVIEGTDSSGKQTQAELLYARLIKEGKKVKKISFPNYESDASYPVKMYLAGEFGKTAESVNAYAASVLFSVDRFASFKKEWEAFYNEGGIIIADRYTTSNMVHQASKLEKGIDQYLEWLEDLEFNKIGLPRPKKVIFLNMPYDKAFELMENRKNKITGEKQKDIHEKDKNYLIKSYDNACYVAKKYKWKEVMCTKESKLKTREEISMEIYDYIKDIL